MKRFSVALPPVWFAGVAAPVNDRQSKIVVGGNPYNSFGTSYDQHGVSAVSIRS
jgi:hypothetical protein